MRDDQHGRRRAPASAVALEGQVVANAAIVPAGYIGSTNVFVTNTTDVIIDTNGYFGP